MASRFACFRNHRGFSTLHCRASEIGSHGKRDLNIPSRSHRIMEGTQRTLVILLSMHRSGSSLTANAFMEQGLSLGPWALLPAHRGNPHGHFEAIPILEVNLAVQTLIHGFREDLPETEEAVAAFLAT